MINQEIKEYNNSQSENDSKICNVLAREINKNLKGAENKLWHMHPVWFVNGNPIAGYSKLKDCIRLLFWSGQSFDEPGLVNEGKFRAAEKRYNTSKQIDKDDLKRWLEKAAVIQWDYKNIVKRKGVLIRL